MAFEAPNLDSRTFTELVNEARDRIPRFTPDWTNLNDSDPGMTLVKLQAWLTETLLYEVNRVPELNYIKFLQLLNVTPKPAEAAKTELHFTLKKLDGDRDALRFFIPKNAQIEADDPELSTPVIFETDSTLSALNAIVGSVIASKDAGMALVSHFDSKKVLTRFDHSFYPFGDSPVNDAICYIGLLLRPHRKAGVDYSQDIFPSGELDLAVSAVEVFEKDAEGSTLEGPLGKQSFLPFEIAEQQDLLAWEVYTGSDFTDDAHWETLYPPVDESAALSRSGHLRPMLADGLSQISLHQLPRSLWVDMGLNKIPTSGQELIDDLRDTELQYDVDNIKDISLEIIVPADSLETVQGSCGSPGELADALKSNVGVESLQLAGVTREDWLGLDVGYSDPAVPAYSMAWVRVRLLDASVYQPKALNGFYLNTVSATAVVTRVQESLGHSDGRPAQQFTLAKKPVYYSPQTSAPDIQLDVVEAGESVSWERVDDFFATDSHSTVYRLDPGEGVVTFGDGVNGRIPVAGSSIIVRHYRYGGGADGNVGANTVSKIKTSLPQVDSVTNTRQASGGRSLESLENAKLRAPHDLKTRDRAVTADDFAFLAKQTQGVPVHTAYALSRTALDVTTQEFISQDGAVTVVILPANAQQLTPQPTEAQLEAVCEQLNRKRLITTELYVTGPRYLAVESLEVEVRVLQSADLQAVSDAIYAKLLSYFHPLYGGEEGRGWPFGEDLFLGSIYDLLLDIEGVRRAVSLSMKLDGVAAEQCQDVLPVPEGYLLNLSADVISLKVVYDER